MASGTNSITGQYVGDGAARDIPLPFNPSYVRIVSVTENAITEQTKELEDGNSLQAVLADVSAISLLDTGEGITLGVGKFSIGDNANINTADSVYTWLAIE